MRPRTMVTLIFVASLLVFARTGAAQGQMQNMQTPSSGPSGQPSAKPAAPGDPMSGMMSPDMMQMMMHAQGGDGHGHDGGGGGPLAMVGKLTKALDDPQTCAQLGISDEQAASLRKLITDTEILTIQTAANVAVDSIQLRELLRPDKPDKAAVMSKGDEISKATSQLITRYLSAIVEAKTILTPEQQKKLTEYLDSNTSPMPPVPPPHIAHR